MGESGAGRRSATAPIFLAVATGMAASFAVLTVGSLVAADLAGSGAWSGAPASAMLVGAAGGAASTRWGRIGGPRAATLRLGFLAAAGAAVGSLAAIAWWGLAALLGMMVVMGVGESANQLSRYLAAELDSSGRRGSALGAGIGPLLVEPAGHLLAALGQPTNAGGFLVGTMGYGLAAALLALVPRQVRSTGRIEPHRRVRRGGCGGPALDLARVSLVTGHVVMILLMTMAPVLLRQRGGGLEVVGAVMSVHVLGMFGPAPVAGRLADRFGPLRVVAAGQLMLCGAVLAAALSWPSSPALFGFALFVLGVGWSFGFVGASSVIAGQVPAVCRVGLQGGVEALGWSAAAAASLASGLLAELLGFRGLCLVSGLLLAIPGVTALRVRATSRRLPSTEEGLLLVGEA